MIYGSPAAALHRSEKYSTFPTAVSFSVMPFCFNYQLWDTDFSKMITTWQSVFGMSKSLNPGLSTVEIGSMSFSKQYATNLVAPYTHEKKRKVILSYLT